MIIPESNFPESVDDLLFFQDINLDNLDGYNEFNTLIKNEEYTSASTFLNKANFFAYNADLFNKLEERIYNTQKRIEAKVKPKFTTYVKDGIIYAKDNLIWISDEEDIDITEPIAINEPTTTATVLANEDDELISTIKY